MTARKLPMPGLRDRTRGEEGEDAAVGPAAAAARGWGVLPPSSHAQQVGNENGCAAPPFAVGGRGEQQHQARCGNSSSQAGLASSIMQPLPLASRYVGAAKHDGLPASSALASSWIRRFLPTTGRSTAAELGKEVTWEAKTVWRGGQAGQAAPVGDGESGSQPAGPLLLAAAPNEQSKEQQQQQREGIMAKRRMGFDSGGETPGKVSRNGEHIPKGKAPVEREERESRQETVIGKSELAENGAKESLRKVNAPPSYAGGSYPVEGGSSRLQLHEGNHITVLSTRGESPANGTVVARLTGFGPFQVVKKLPASDYGKVGGSGGPKPKGVDGEARVEAEAAQPNTHRFSNNGNDLLDRRPSGTSTMASQTGTKFTPPLKSKPLEDLWSGRPPCTVKFAGARGFPRPTNKEDVELDGIPFMVRIGGGAREIAAVVGGEGLKVSESAARFNPFGERNFKSSLETGHHKFLDHESEVERRKIGSSKFNGESHPPANLGRKEDGGPATESKFLSRAAEDAGARLNAGAGSPTGLENRKMKGVVGSGFPSGTHAESSPSQQQHSPEIPFHGLHPLQGDLFTGKVGHPLPYSPHSSFPGEDNSGEDTRNSRGREDRAKSSLTPLFDAPKVYDDGLENQAGQPEQHAPWTSLYTAFKGLKHAEVANSSSSTPTLPLDVHSRLQGGTMPASRSFDGHNVDGNRDEASGGGRGRNDAHLPASPEARSRFDNQSSHFSSSSWPDKEGQIPNDDAGSGPYNSQATGSGYHSQASRVANRSSGESKAKHMGTCRSQTGGQTQGLDKVARSRESFASEPDLRKYAGSQGEDEGQQTYTEGNQAHVPSIPLKHSPTQATSGHKDDTSASSPPSYPPGYNSSDSPVLPRGIVDEHLLSITGKLKVGEVDSELEGSRVPRMHKENRRDEGVFALKRTNKNMNSLKYDNEAVYREHKELRSFLSKDPDLQRARPSLRDTNRELNEQGRSIDGVEPELRQGKLRMSGEAMGEGGISGSSKRTRHHFNLGSNDLGSQTAGSGMPSNWLKRWLPPSTGDAAKSPAGFARPKDVSRNGLTFEPPRSNVNTNFIASSEVRSAQVRIAEVAKGKEIEKRNEAKARNGLKGSSAKRGLLGMSPHPIPSAAAIALVGTATMKMGPFPQQRKGPVAMWPPVHLHTAQAPESGQRSSS